MGKYIAGILGLIALVWTGYVAINIASSGPAISPSSVFAKGENVLVTHHPFEFQTTEISTQIFSSEPFFETLLENPERVQHMYFSEAGNKALMQRSKPWTTEIVKMYFRRMQLQADFASSRKLTLSNGWTARFDKEFLLIEKKESKLKETSSPDWKYVDGKCAFSLVSWQKSIASIENVYQSGNGDLTYVSNGNPAGSMLADDQDAFLDVIPDAFDDYTFYEKEYLRYTDPVSSIAYSWVNKGFVVIESKGMRCIITDFLPGQDPIAILGDAMEEASINDAKTSGFTNHSPLPGTLTHASSWYIEIFNNRVFIAEEKQAIDQIIGAYEAGRTLSQDTERLRTLLGNVPRKVSYRHISAEGHKSISLLEGSKHTVIRTLVEIGENTAAKPKGLDPIRIESGISQIMPLEGKNFMYVVAKNGTVFGIGKEKVLWQADISQKINGEAVFSGSGEELLITTNDQVHIFNQSGEIAGFPKNNNGNTVVTACYFNWKGQNQLAIADKGSVSIYNSGGQRTSYFKLPYAPAAQSMIVWVNNRELMASFIGEQKGFTVSIDKKRKSAEFGLNAGETKLIKTQSGAVYFNLSGGLLQRITWNGSVTPVSGNASKILGMEKSDTYRLLVLSGGNIAVFSEDGSLLNTIKPGFNDVESASITQNSGGRFFIGVLDGLSNYNSVFSLNGKPATTETYEGSKLIRLHRLQNGSIQLISQSNNYLVRYPVN